MEQQSPHESQLQQSIIEDHTLEAATSLAPQQFDVKIYQSNTTVSSSVTANQLDIAERCKLWKESRERRLKEAQDVRQQLVFDAAGCTFQPNISRPQVRKRGGQMSYTQQDFDQQLATDNHQKGLDRYLQRMDKAKDIKEQKAKLEDHLYNRDKKWTPKLTQPMEPKLTAFLNKDRKEVTVKALSKPVDILGQSSELVISKSAGRKEDDKKSSGIRGSQTRTQDFINMTLKSKSQFVDIKPEMTYEDAVVMIHQHILGLDL